MSQQEVFAKEDHDKINYLRFSPDFKIVLNGRSKIILGANGVGKTSIYKVISEKDCHCIDYGDIEESFKNNKKILTIAANTKKLESIINEKNLLKDNKINMKKRLQNSFGTSDKRILKAIDPSLEKIVELPSTFCHKFTNNKFDILRKLSEEDKSFLFKNVTAIIESKNTELDIMHLKAKFLQVAFDDLERHLDDDMKVCPICDSLKDRTIKEIIAEQKKKLLISDDNLVKEALTSYRNLNSNEIKSHVEGIKHKIRENGVGLVDIISFALDQDPGHQLLENLQTLEKIENDISKLESEREIFYNLLKKEESDIKDEFVNNFEVKNRDLVNFDNKKKEIKITLPRDVADYSTGEIRLMLFMVYIYKGIASDKDFIVIDDPLSSYDIANQYKIIYQIVFAHHRKEKILLVFTHNIDTLNIANSQYPGFCDYQYIEKYDGLLHIQDIKPIKKDTFLKIKHLLDKKDLKSAYLRFLISRENENEDFEGHKIFHYNASFKFQYQGFELSSEYFADLIDDFKNDFGNYSFQDNIINKIIYLSAIRVWIEKQFHLKHPEDKNLESRKTLTKKIDYLFPEKDEQVIWKGSKKVTRGFLMGKKVMLNQNMHVESQRVPFEYALNLSIHGICKEIKEIKEAFGEVKN